MIQKRSFLFLVLLLIALIGAPAFAENATLLTISVDRGTPITLSAPAANVFIANPDIADIQVMSPTSVMVFGKKTGTTTLMATDSTGRTLLNRTVVVSQDLSDLRHELMTAIPGNKINAESVPDGIVLTGTTRDPLAVEDARKIASRYVTKDGTVINRIQVLGSNQILLRVRFAEMSRSVDKQFGINWGMLTSTGGFVFGLASGAPSSSAASLGSLSGIGSLSTLNGETTALGGTNSIDGAGFSHSGGRWNVNGLIDALASDGLVTLLAEPNLSAMSGETANFLAGGQVPVITPQQNGSFSIQYVSYGIQLEFTPTLVGENRINLHVKPEVSEPSSVGAVVTSEGTITAFTTRKAETTVELGSGQSFAIAGLLDNSQNQAIDKFPFLGDVPVLGPLFRSSDFQNDQSELIIVVTPYVVKAGDSEQAMALPMDGYSPPSDSEMLLGLRNSSGDPNARPMSGNLKAVPAVAPIPNPDTSMIDPDAVQPLPKTPATTLGNLGVDLPPENSAQSDNDTSTNVSPAPAVTAALSNLHAPSPAVTSTPETAPPPIPEPTVAAVAPMAPAAPVSPPVMPVAPVSTAATAVTKNSSSPSSSPSGFILE